MLNFKKTLTTLVLAGSLLSNTSHADIIISGTRIIYDENKKDVSIRLENKGTRPLLVQNWIDLGNDNADPGSIKAPFVSTPPGFTYRTQARSIRESNVYPNHSIAKRP